MRRRGPPLNYQFWGLGLVFKWFFVGAPDGARLLMSFVANIPGPVFTVPYRAGFLPADREIGVPGNANLLIGYAVGRS